MLFAVQHKTGLAEYAGRTMAEDMLPCYWNVGVH